MQILSALGLDLSSASGDVKASREEEQIEPRLLAKLSLKSEIDVANELRMSNSDQEAFAEISIPVTINLFCAPGKMFQLDYFNKEMSDFGLSKLAAHKLHIYLTKLKNAEGTDGEAYNDIQTTNMIPKNTN